MAVGLGVLAILSIVLSVMVVIQCFKPRTMKYSKFERVHIAKCFVVLLLFHERNKHDEIQLDKIDHGAMDSQMAGAQVQEIGESAVDTTAETAATLAQAATPMTVPLYEDVKPLMSAKSRDSYKVTQCAAYGVVVNN